MCGLVAIALKAQSGALNADLSLFSEMLYMDALRGWDSTGVASFHNDGSMRALKEATQATHFIASKEYGKWLTEGLKDGKVFIGHNRKSTVGKTTDETAHPFMLEKNRFAFIHNGTLRNHEKIHKTEVDSEALGMLLTACEGDVEKLETALSDVEGAYACMWIDQHKKKLYMLRNFERPLYIAETSIGYIIGSEYGFIAAACVRNKVEFKGAKLIDTDTLITIDLSDYQIAKTEEKLTITKKAVATPGPQNTGEGTTATNSANTSTFHKGEVSKNQFKKIRKQFIGKSQTFWLDDYNSRVIGGAASLDWLVWGTSELFEFDHICEGLLNNIDEESLLETFDLRPITGTIEDVLYEPDTKQVTFKFKNLSSTVKSATLH